MALMETTAAAATESAKLQRHFGRFDILFFLVCTIVGVDTIAAIAGAGGEAFTWTLIYAVIFFVPQALLFAELGSAFPQEGGPYFWTRLAFGRLVGAVNNFLYWVTNPVWIGGSRAGACVGAVSVFFTSNDSLSTPATYVVALAFVWVTIVTAIASFRVGKWVPTAGAFARFLLLGLFSVSVIVYGFKHGAQGLSHVSDYRPTASGFVLLVGLLLFNYVGFELPSSAGEEMINPQRDVAVRDLPVRGRLGHPLQPAGHRDPHRAAAVGDLQLQRASLPPSGTCSPSTAGPSPRTAPRR